MNRRDFLEALGIAGLSLPFRRRFWPGWRPPTQYIHKTYALGFAISKEMLEDDALDAFTYGAEFVKRGELYLRDGGLYSFIDFATPHLRDEPKRLLALPTR